ncbi:MAG TPA: hypothetical protein ENK31_06380 [Nannocystis exedens]|nr:hypothetical protein [Nannocystis exedens]
MLVAHTDHGGYQHLLGLAARLRALWRPTSSSASDEEPILLSDPASALIMHRANLERDAPQIVSRVQLDGGEALWSAELGDRVQLRLAHATNSVLCLALLVPNGDTTLLGLNPDNGTRIYRVDLN